MLALAGSSHETTALLLSRGADVSAKNRHGTRPLHFAAGYNASLDTVRLLLESGAAAHIDEKNHHYRTPLTVAKDRGRDEVAALFREFQSRL